MELNAHLPSETSTNASTIASDCWAENPFFSSVRTIFSVSNVGPCCHRTAVIMGSMRALDAAAAGGMGHDVGL